MPKVPYPYEVNGKFVTGNGSLIPICSLSNRSLLPSLTVLTMNDQPYDDTFKLKTFTHFYCLFYNTLLALKIYCEQKFSISGTAQ